MNDSQVSCVSYHKCCCLCRCRLPSLPTVLPPPCKCPCVCHFVVAACAVCRAQLTTLYVCLYVCPQASLSPRAPRCAGASASSLRVPCLPSPAWRVVHVSSAWIRSSSPCCPARPSRPSPGPRCRCSSSPCSCRGGPSLAPCNNRYAEGSCMCECVAVSPGTNLGTRLLLNFGHSNMGVVPTFCCV